MGLVHCKGEVLLLLQGCGPLGVLQTKLGLHILGLQITAQSSEAVSLLFPSSPQLEKSSRWLIPSITVSTPAEA